MSFTTLLLDADGVLFPSEEPAFAASARVMRDLAERFGLTGDYSPRHLRRTTTGQNFRTTVRQLLARHHLTVDDAELERWVEREKHEVTAHLRAVLCPRPDVLAAVSALRCRYRLAVVSSSALSRLAACLTSSGLDELLPDDVRFSAEDSLPAPSSKPDPAVYRTALRQLSTGAAQTMAVEDSPSGAAAAVAAGIATVGLVQFVPAGERADRARSLYDAGASLVVWSWRDLVGPLAGPAAVPA